MMDCDLRFLRFTQIRASSEIIYLSITQCIQKKEMYLVDSTPTTFHPKNSYVTNAYQISQIRQILLLHIFRHGYAIIINKMNE